MTDRELLELAAKAAGLHAGTEDGMYDDLKWWNPLRDDRDALRLAVKLKFAINVWEGCTVMTGGGLNAKCVMEDISADPYAATRRAIVKAAAEIGRSM